MIFKDLFGKDDDYFGMSQKNILKQIAKNTSQEANTDETNVNTVAKQANTTASNEQIIAENSVANAKLKSAEATAINTDAEKAQSAANLQKIQSEYEVAAGITLASEAQKDKAASNLLATQSELALGNASKSNVLTETAGAIAKGASADAAKDEAAYNLLLTQSEYALSQGNTTSSATEMLETAAMKAQSEAAKEQAAANLLAMQSEYGMAVASGAATGATSLLGKAASAAFGLIKAHPIIAAIAVIGGLAFAIYKIHDAVTVTLEEQKEKLDEANKKFDETNNELKSINSELDTTKSRIKELENLGTLTFTEQAELNKLRETTRELELQKKLKQDMLVMDAENLYEENKKTFEKEYNDADTHGYSSGDEVYQDLKSGEISIGRLDSNIYDMIAAYKYLNEEKLKSTDPEEIKEYDQYLQSYETQIASKLTNLSEYKTNLLKIADIRPLDEWEQAFYDSLSDVQKQIYEFYSPETWNNLEIDSIFNTDGMKISKDKFIQVVKDALTNNPNEDINTVIDEVIQKFPTLNEAIKSSNLILGDCKDNTEAFANEIYAYASRINDVVSIDNTWKMTSENSNAISDYQSKVEKLGTALQALQNGTSDDPGFLTNLTTEFPELANQSGNLEGAIQTLIDKLQNDLYTTLGEGLPDNIRKDLDSYTQSAMGLSKTLDEAFSSIQSTFSALKDFKKEMSSGNFTDSTLNSVASLSDELNSLVAGYYAGVVSADQLYTALQNHYNTDQQNYAKALILKNQYNDDFYNKLGLADAAVINSFKDNYGVDLSNCTNYNKAKIAIEQQTLGTIGDMWSKYYNIQSQMYTSDMEQLGRAAEGAAKRGVSDETNRSLVLAKTIGKQVQQYQNAISALDNIIYDNTSVQFDKISTTLEANSDSSKSQSEEVFDWFETKIKNLDNQINQLKTDTENVLGALAKNSLIDSSINLTKQKLSEYSSAIDMYQSEASKALSKLSSDMQDKVVNGALSIETYTGNDDTVTKAISNYQKWADKIAECTENVSSLRAELRQLALEQFNNVAEDYDDKTAVYDQVNEILDDTASMYEAQGVSGGKALYEEQARLIEKILQEQTTKRQGLIDQVNKSLNDGTIIEGDEAWQEMQLQILAVDDSIVKTNTDLTNTNNKLGEIAKNKFDAISESFSNRYDIYDNAKSMIDKQIQLLEASGEVVGKGYYEEQIRLTEEQKKLLERERSDLADTMTSALADGSITIGDSNWLDMVKTINTIDSGLADCTAGIENFNNAIQQLHWDNLERVSKVFDNTSSEISHILNLFDGEDVADETGNWTDAGIAQLGLNEQLYETNIIESQKYGIAIEQLNADYKDGKYSSDEYANKLSELSEKQWTSIEAANSARDAIVSLNQERVDAAKEAIQEEIDAYKELTDAQIEALDAEKDLHDYQKSIADKNKNIAKLQKQIAAMQGDNTAASVAKRKKLESELADAMEDKEEAQYDHSVEVQKEALTKQSEEYEKSKNAELEALDATMKNIEQIISSSLSTVKANADTVEQEINRVSTQNGITLSSIITSPWKSGQNAIGSYGDEVGLKLGETSEFAKALNQAVLDVESLATNADAASQNTSGLYGLTAETLVEGLGNAYTAMQNLQNEADKASTNTANLFGQKAETLVGQIESAKKALEDLNNTNYNPPSTDNDDDSPAPAPVQQPTTNNTGKTDTENTGRNNIDPPVKKKYDVVYEGVTLVTFDNENDAEKFIMQSGEIQDQSRAHIKAYAKGVHNLKEDELAWLNDQPGSNYQEAIISPTNNAVLVPLSKGDSVLTAAETENLFNLAKNPNAITKMLGDNTSGVKMPTILSQNSVSEIKIDNILTINGNVDDTNVARMENVAKEAIAKAFKQFNDARKYGK